MEIILIFIGTLFIVVGFLGCFLPVIPGPPIAWVALMLLQTTEKENRPFTTQTLVIWAIVVAFVTVLDYVVPIWGTKKFGGSSYGTWGSTIGLIIGLFMGPFGIIIGPFIGAVVGELIGGMSTQRAIRAGVGSFLGFLTGVLLKLAVTIWMGVLFFRAAWDQIVAVF